SLRQRVTLLRGVPASALEDVWTRRLRLNPGAETLVRAAQAAGLKTLLVSGGFTFFTDRLKDRLGIDHTAASTLEIVDGRLTGRITGEIVDGAVKARAFARLRAGLSGDGGIAVAIGDGANDLPMLRHADVSVGYRAKPVVRVEATHAIDHCGLDAVLNLFA
ncbi:MAG TPA: HAD-IB family phosphatase, partial [Casimicrobiaceae bacterium]|nr:HAD-IB family phosphatase [Casimicrobiaceae bacterium]